MGLRPLEIFLLLQCGDRVLSSESDVYRRQVLSTKVYPRAVRVNLCKREWENIINKPLGKYLVRWTCAVYA